MLLRAVFKNLNQKKMFPTAIILRGISGVGKTVLRKLLKVALKALDKNVKIISKDDYRKMHQPWLYTKEQESQLNDWYADEYSKSIVGNYDYIISDTTMCRGTEFKVPFSTLNIMNTGRLFIINIGTPDSLTNSDIGEEHINHQRDIMRQTQPLLDSYEKKGYCHQYYIDARSSVEEGITDIVKELVI